MVALRSVRTLVLLAGGAVLLVGLLFGVLLPSAHAQSQRADDMFYGRLGGGLSDFTSDLSSWRPTHPFGGGKFTRGAGPPFVFVGEVGYQFSPHWALGIGIQGGNYPVEVYPEIEGISDSYRYSPRVLGRYTMGGGAVAPYVDLGVHATLGGDRPPTRIGAGPSVGGGVDIRLGRAASLYVESRVNLTVPSGAVDGSDAGTRFDVTGQLLGIGLKVHLTAPTPPRIIRLEGPDTLDTGTSVTFAATVNEEAADRPLDYQWDFGDGATATGRTATHAYDRPGRYVVSFSARNRAGTAEASTAVVAEPPPEPPQIATARAAPEPAAAGATVQFSAAATGGNPIAYEWRFGDGASAEAASPTHTYETPGTYTARLRVSNPDGDDTRTVTVRVARPAGADTSGAAAAAQNPTDSSETGPPAVPPADTSVQERWGIVVASMSEEGQAAPVARRYRERLPEPLRVEVRVAESDRGVRRHRVVIGPFEGTEAAQQVLRERAEMLPSGAWLLRLE
ncbi:PKD domain-containing protein [Salinibacter ruber]|uniref:PKD domain-containing protein n=1 Tax=Salinibacter ruber TaxID=146919 RepID=UPI00216770AC|nr:PKD domain-containing protein [Salinibacter ruber]MCS3703822.1 chitodextrinase [Salinibacter ruber]